MQVFRKEVLLFSLFSFLSYDHHTPRQRVQDVPAFILKKVLCVSGIFIKIGICVENYKI
jgi:hypothetical protein